MKNPKLITKPFAQNGQKNAIPENFSSSMESNQATWDTGFGQITMIPVAAGGMPPKGQDFNGIFNQISENVVYLSKGGRFKFSADYAAAINGYPKGAILQSDDETKEYQSIIDNNKVNFNTATQAQINAAWKLISTDDMLLQIAGKQPSGNYASGELFFKATNYVGMQTEKKNYAVLLYEDGRVALWDEGNRKIQWEFDKNGHLTKGLIPISGGGTGATDVASARKNLSVYSIQEVNTELDKKASGSCFYDNATHTGMQTRSKLYAVAVSDTGTFGAWDGQTQRYAFSFDKTGQMTNGVVPVARIAGLSEIGVNQSWVDVTKQRALNTAYTNSTSKPIFVSATCKLQKKLTSIELWIGGVKASTYYKDSNSDSAVCAIVPAGANYTIRATEGDILTWAELR